MKIKNLYVGSIHSLECSGVLIKNTSFETFSGVIFPKFIKKSLFYKCGNHVYDLLDKNKCYKVKEYNECNKMRPLHTKFVVNCKYIGDKISDKGRLSKRKILSIYNEKVREK